MNRLTILVALTVLAACTSPRESPTSQRSSAKVAQPSHFDFSDLPDKQLPLTQFLKECQARTGFNFTYGAEAQAVIEKSSVRFSRAEPMTPVEFDAALQQVLRTRGLEAERIGPEHLNVYYVRLPKK